MMELTTTVHVPYRGKFLRGSIFADGQSLPIVYCTAKLISGLIFAVRQSSAKPYVSSSIIYDKTAKIGPLENFPLYGMEARRGF